MSPRKAVEEELGKDKIMQAARELFVSQGYRSVSMRAIAGKLGYSHGALYYHFKDKAELFSAMVIDDFGRLNALLESIADEDWSVRSGELLERVFVSYIRFGLENKPNYEMMFLVDESELNDQAKAAKMRSYEHFSTVVLQSLQQSGEAGGVSLRVPWSLFLSLHGFVAYYLHTDQSCENMEGLALQHAHLLVRAVGQ